MNLDYFLLASELPSYNYRSNYAFPNTDGDFNDYNAYALNTLGYLERKVQIASDNDFNAIRATCIDGRPQYEFINRDDFERMLPQTGLYRPIVLSEERYNELGPRLGHLIIQVQCKEYSNTSGVNAYDMEPVELKAGYKAKVPINDNGFEYPISYISIDVLKGSGYYAQDFIVNELYYTIDQGNLYFTKSLEEIISESEQYKDFETALNSGLVDSLIYYKVHIYFDIFVPDTTEKTHSLALAQATQHAVMDYFNQYTYAEVTANMISEIAYTETITFWSTLISSAAIYFGSWAVMGTEAFMAKAGVQSVAALIGQGAVKMLTSAIQETFEEIIKDGFIEALIESFIDIVGWSEELGFWLSSLATSIREVKGALGQLALGRLGPDLKNDIALLKEAINAGDTKTEADMRQKIEQTLQQQQEAESWKQEERKTWERLLKSGFFKGIFMALPAVLFGSFTFLTLKGLSSIGKGTISLAPEKFAAFKAKINVFKKGKISQVSGQNSKFSRDNLQKQLKKPSDLDSAIEDVNNAFQDQQESEIETPPLVDVLNSIDYNPKDIKAKEVLANKFNEVRLANWISELIQDERFAEKKATFENIRSNLKSIDLQKTKKDIITTIRDALRDKKDLRYIDINGILMYDPNFVLVGLPHHNPEQEIDVIFNQPIKDFVVDLKRNYYGISYKLRLGLLRDGNLVEIDENSNEDMARWLIKNGYSKEETVYILPVDKDYNGPIYEEAYWPRGTGVSSPYTDHFDDFRKGLRELAYRTGLVNDYTYSATSRLLLPSNERYLTLAHTEMKLGNHFGIEDTTLLTIHSRFVNKLEDHFTAGQVTEREYVQYAREIENLFNEQYSIYGFIRPNPFYFEGRLNAHKIGDILMDNGFIDKNALTSDLYEFVHPFGGSRGALTMASYKTEDYRYSVPMESTYTKLRESFVSAIFDFAARNNMITDEIAENAIDEESALMNDFIQRIKDIKDARALFNKYDRRHAKIDLLMLIQDSHPVLRQITSLEKFSKLLFNDEDFLKDNFLRELSSRPDPYRLNRITFSAERWVTNDFDNLISELELEDIKNKVQNIVYSWMFSNPSEYTQPYFSDSPRRFGKLQEKSFLKLEYELVQALTYAVSAHNDKDTTVFGEMLRELNIPSKSMDKLLTTGISSASVKDLLRAKTTIVSYILDGSMTEQKLRFYDKALNKIDEYFATRNLRLFEEKLVSRRGYDKTLWNDDKITAYHVIALLCRDLGFDPITFQPLEPQIFDGDRNTGLYARHHPDIFRKFSVYLQDLFLVDNSQHWHYDTQISLEHQKTLVKIIQDLIQNDGSGPNKEITAKDIVRTFLNNFGDPNIAKFYLEEYWRKGDFLENLKDFNDRKDMIKSGKYEEFIRTKYNDAYTRFFNNAMGILNSLTSLSDYKGYRMSRVFSIADIAYLKRVFNI